ncbi:MAG TPA: hypothetical protein VGJ45_04890 [Pseudonocardiaceae bacterium]
MARPDEHAVTRLVRVQHERTLVPAGPDRSLEIFPITGSMVMAARLYLLSRLDAHTAYRVIAIDMMVLGLGFPQDREGFLMPLPVGQR